MRHIHFFIITFFMFLISCADKSVQLTDAEKSKVAKEAISQLPARGSMTQITRVAVTGINYEVFNPVKKTINGVELSVLPMKVSGNALYEQNLFFNLIHGYLRGWVTLHVYKNEVNDLKYDILESDISERKIFDERFPMNIRKDAKSFIGIIKSIEKKPTSFDGFAYGIEMENKKYGQFIGGVPNSVADFINEKVNVGDRVIAYYYLNGPHAFNYTFVYEIDKIPDGVDLGSGNPPPPIAEPNQ